MKSSDPFKHKLKQELDRPNQALKRNHYSYPLIEHILPDRGMARTFLLLMQEMGFGT